MTTTPTFHPAHHGDICIAVNRDTGRAVAGMVVLAQRGEVVVIDTGPKRISVHNWPRYVEPQGSFRGEVVERFGDYASLDAATAAIAVERRAT